MVWAVRVAGVFRSGAPSCVLLSGAAATVVDRRALYSSGKRCTVVLQDLGSRYPHFLRKKNADCKINIITTTTTTSYDCDYYLLLLLLLLLLRLLLLLWLLPCTGRGEQGNGQGAQSRSKPDRF